MPTAEMAIRTHAHSRLHHEQRLRHTPIISPLRDLEPACYGDMLLASGARRPAAAQGVELGRRRRLLVGSGPVCQADEERFTDHFSP